MKSLRLKLGLTLVCLLFGFVAIITPSFISSVSAGTVSLEGNGTAASPYLIQSVEDLEVMRYSIASGADVEGDNVEYDVAEYKLTTALELDGVWTPIGNEEHKFKGVFDGNGKTISGLVLAYDQNNVTPIQGLFGVVSGATIKNLGVDIQITIEDIKTQSEVDGQTVTESSPMGKLIVGGLAGKVDNSEIFACKANFSLKASTIELLTKNQTKSPFFTAVNNDIAIENNQFTIDQITYTIGTNVVTYDDEQIPIVNNKFLINGIEYTLGIDKISYNSYETYRYMGEIVCGGIVGEMTTTSIRDCYSQIDININQSGSNTVNSYFGGIAGFVNNGEMYNLYVAPTQTLVNAISSKNGAITAVSADKADVKIINEKNGSNIVFGGIIGYAKGSRLTVYNSVFSTLMASLSVDKIVRGGIIGQISINTSEQPEEVQYAKYLSIANGAINVLTFQGGIGNSTSASYIVSANVSATNAMPTQSVFTGWAWNEFRSWDYVNIWKSTSIIKSSGYFFPSLQMFSSFTISLSGSKEVVYTGTGAYSSGYYTLELAGSSATSAAYEAGERVTIIATFYDGEGNVLRDFKNYFKFTDWLKGSYSIGKIVYAGEENATANSEEDATVQAVINGGGYGIILDEVNGTTTIMFNASADKEGAYDVRIKGRPVTINVSLLKKETEETQAGIGSVTKTIGNNVESKTANFFFVMQEYLNGDAVTLAAVNAQSSQYIFANIWSDGNSMYNAEAHTYARNANSRTLVFELNNERNNTLSRFYPIVLANEEGELEANIICYFSNNTSILTIEFEGKGNVKINDIDMGSSETNTSLINNQEVTLIATPDDGHVFNGWYINGEKVSDTNEYVISISKAETIEAKFEIASNGGAGLQAWIIALIVITPLVIGVIITFIIIKVKRNSTNNYKKRYKF